MITKRAVYIFIHIFIALLFLLGSIVLFLACLAAVCKKYFS